MSQGNLFEELESHDSAKTNELAHPKCATTEASPCVNGNEVGASDRTFEVGKAQPPTFPVDAFPSWLSDMVSGTAISLQTPVDLTATIALATLSLICAGVKVEVKDGWTEPLNVYAACNLPVACRKTPSFDAMLWPVREFEKALQAEAAPLISKARAKRDVLEGRLQRLKKSAASSAPDPSYLEEASDLAVEVDTMKISAHPILFTSDVTPEGVVRMLEEQMGRAAVFSDEGGELIDNISGRYSSSGQCNMEVLLKAHAGTSIKVLRADRNRTPISIDNPALSIAVCLQPTVIERIWQRVDLNERGMIARFLWSVPLSPLGKRTARPPSCQREIVENYQHTVSGLLRVRYLPEKQPNTDVIRFSPEAQDLILDLVDELEPELGSGGRYEHMAGWVGKLAGTIARIAGLLHVANAPERVERAHGEAISEETMLAAIRIGRYFLAHAEHAYRCFGGTAEKVMQARILGWIRQNGIGCFSERDLIRALGVKKVHIVEPIGVLQDGGYIEEAKDNDPAQPGRTGRKPSRQWRVLPLPKLISSDLSIVSDKDPR